LFSIRSHDEGAVDTLGPRHVRGLSLEIGVAFRGTVVRQERLNQPTTWLASVNAGYLGEYFDRATAIARVEDTIEHNMKLVLEDWEMYRATREQRTA
jgi:hypothetical protein